MGKIREDRIRMSVTVNRDISKSLDVMADEIGISKTALIAVVLGQYVTSIDKVYEMANEALKNAIKDTDNQVTNDILKK